MTLGKCTQKFVKLVVFGAVFILCVFVGNERSLLSQSSKQEAQLCTIEGSRKSSKPIKVDRLGDPDSAKVITFLHGSGGPETHLGWINGFTKRGFLVLVPHYFDATSGRDATDQHYAEWAQAVADVMYAEKQKLPASTSLSLVGYSLGASIALTVSTQCQVAEHVVSWEGSLPDYYYAHLRVMPHLLIVHGDDDQVIPYINASQLAELCTRVGGRCELKKFKGQGHVFSSSKALEAEDAIAAFIAGP